MIALNIFSLSTGHSLQIRLQVQTSSRARRNLSTSNRVDGTEIGGQRKVWRSDAITQSLRHTRDVVGRGVTQPRNIESMSSIVWTGVANFAKWKRKFRQVSRLVSGSNAIGSGNFHHRHHHLQQWILVWIEVIHKWRYTLSNDPIWFQEASLSSVREMITWSLSLVKQCLMQYFSTFLGLCHPSGIKN